jgi:hypothetical protein
MKVRIRRTALAAVLVATALVAVPGAAHAADCTATRTGTYTATARCLSTPVRAHALCFAGTKFGIYEAWGLRVPAGSTSTVSCYPTTLVAWGAIAG